MVDEALQRQLRRARMEQEAERREILQREAQHRAAAFAEFAAEAVAILAKDLERNRKARPQAITQLLNLIARVEEDMGAGGQFERIKRRLGEKVVQTTEMARQANAVQRPTNNGGD